MKNARVHLMLRLRILSASWLAASGCSGTRLGEQYNVGEHGERGWVLRVRARLRWRCGACKVQENRVGGELESEKLDSGTNVVRGGAAGEAQSGASWWRGASCVNGVMPWSAINVGWAGGKPEGNVTLEGPVRHWRGGSVEQCGHVRKHGIEGSCGEWRGCLRGLADATTRSNWRT